MGYILMIDDVFIFKYYFNIYKFYVVKIYGKIIFLFLLSIKNYINPFK